MSIATDEADKKYPVPTDVDDPMYKYVESIVGYPSAKRQGYIAGRTAEPTEAEIEAADKALLQAFRDNSNMLANKESVHIVLEAARKAVME